MRYLFICLLIPVISFSQKLFVENANVSFFSEAPIEDIAAVSSQLDGVVDFETGEFFFRIPINTFIFPSSLMQKHFNEKYMESDKYSLSSFKGLITNLFPYTSDTVVTIFTQGLLNIHGIEKEVSIESDLSIPDTLCFYENHSLVLINNGEASFDEVIYFLNQIKSKILEKFKIELEIEPEIISS